MIILEPHLPSFQKARFWIDELPRMSGASQIKQTIQLESFFSTPVQYGQAAIEWLVPIGFPMYGLLGGEILPASHSFTIEVYLQEKPSEIFVDTIAPNPEQVKCGLLPDFVEAVVQGFCESLKQEQLPCGILRCHIAACCDVGSSEIVFFSLARYLFRLLLKKEVPDYESILKNLSLSRT
jgi:hypothetical protein